MKARRSEGESNKHSFQLPFVGLSAKMSPVVIPAEGSFVAVPLADSLAAFQVSIKKEGRSLGPGHCPVKRAKHLTLI